MGATNELEVALLQLHRMSLAATIRAGNDASPALTATQIRLLTLLDSAPEGMVLADIAAALFVSPPSASRLCQRLVRDRLADRNAGPGHYIVISLSSRGRRALTSVNQARVGAMTDLLESVPEGEHHALSEALVALGRAAAEHHDAW